MLVDIFENFLDKCIEIYELDPAHFLSSPGLAWQACLKSTKVNLELLADIDMLFLVQKEITGGICQSIHVHAEANNKYMKNHIISNVFRCKQLVWMSNVPKLSYKWFQMGRKIKIIKI